MAAETSEGSESDTHVSQDFDLAAPSKAHAELRKGFRMSQRYLQGATTKSLSGSDNSQSSHSKSTTSQSAEAATTAATAPGRRVSHRLASTAATNRQKREWWKVAPDAPGVSNDSVQSGGAAVEESKSMTLGGDKRKKTRNPAASTHSNRKTQQQDRKNPTPRSGAGVYQPMD